MNIALHIPSWLLWFAAGFIAGAVVMYFVTRALITDAVGRAFGW